MNTDLQTMKARTSVRSYDGVPLTQPETDALQAAFLAAIPGPFGGKPRFAIVSADSRGKVKMGTYGLISNVPAYIAGAIARSAHANEDFGYAMEGVILEATRLGLGTCWIGGVFDRARATAAVGAKPGDLIPAVVAIGHPSEVRSLADRLIANVASSRTRKDPFALFFDGTFDRHFAMESRDPWTAVLETVRMAPSASNKQPWRIIRTPAIASSPAAFHLYLAADKAYNGVFGDVKLQNVDMGIAMRHFEVAARSLGLPGGWIHLDASPSHPAAASLASRPTSASASTVAGPASSGPNSSGIAPPGVTVSRGRLPRDDKGFAYIATWLA